MKRRFYCQDIKTVGATVELPDDESHHFRNVLRGREGEGLTLMDCAGAIAEGRVISLGHKRNPVICELINFRSFPQPATRISLFVSPIRSKNMPLVIRSATELGVYRIIPTITDRSEARPDGKAPDAWGAAARVACKQSGNPYAPQIDSPQRLIDILEHRKISPGFVGCPSQPALAEIANTEIDEVSLFIGPEGGFTETELDLLFKRHLQPLSIGRWVLRVETAVIACLSWLNQRYRL